MTPPEISYYSGDVRVSLPINELVDRVLDRLVDKPMLAVAFDMPLHCRAFQTRIGRRTNVVTITRTLNDGRSVLIVMLKDEEQRWLKDLICMKGVRDGT